LGVTTNQQLLDDIDVIAQSQTEITTAAFYYYPVLERVIFSSLRDRIQAPTSTNNIDNSRARQEVEMTEKPLIPRHRGEMTV
jgi:hypothetical protein